MGGEIAVILDTNFIFSNAKKMGDLLQTLENKFKVYVTQISVDERKEQACREFEKGYEDVKRFYSKFAFIVEASGFADIGEALDTLRCKMQNKYESSFPDHLIPLNTSKELLETVLDRANRKISPFLAIENASDKGFKDTLIWLSILEYFKTNGEREVIFVSDDNGFTKGADFLCKEFREVTGKEITIKDKNFYKDIGEPNVYEPEQKNTETVQFDFSYIREKIQTIIGDLCIDEGVDYHGDPTWRKTFVLTKPVDSDYMKVIFEHLKNDIINNLFEASVPANEILDLDGRITDVTFISMNSLERALLLYEEIKTNMPDFLPQFYNAVANIINGNYEYRAKAIDFSDFEDLDLDEGDLPF